MNKPIQLSLLPLLTIILCDHNSCFASIYQLKDEIDAYNKRDFQKVVFIGRAILTEDPKNDAARYYLADAYTWLRDFKEAIEEYKNCAYQERNAKIRSYAEQALQVLQNPTNLIVANQPVNSADIANPDQNKSPDFEKRQSILQESDEAVAYATSDAEKQIAEINRNALDGVPSIVFDEFGNTGVNQDYMDLRKSAQDQADAIHNDLPKKISAIKKIYQDKLDALDSSMNKASNFKPGLDNIALIHSTSNLYVQNYANYGVNSLPKPQESLKAVNTTLIPKANILSHQMNAN